MFIISFLVGMIGASVGAILICWIILGNTFTIYGQVLNILYKTYCINLFTKNHLQTVH